MAVIFRLVLCFVIGYATAQDDEDPKTKQKWYDLNSLFIRYGFRLYGECQLNEYVVTSDGRQEELTIQDKMTKNDHFFHITARWIVDETADAAEIKYMPSTQQSPNETLFDIAKDEIESNTCLRFKKIPETADRNCETAGNIDYFCLYEEKGTCAAEYGQNVTKPALFSISENCGHRGVLREFGHILGLHHTTSRDDRGEYIDVSYKHISYTGENFYRRAIFHEYQTCANSTERSLKLPYDYTSIMHPGLLQWSENYELIISAYSPGHLHMIDYAQDFHPHLSHYDKLLLNKIYKCDSIFGKKCASKKCGTLGYLAQNCTCICPKGTSGETCSSVDSTADIYEIPSKPHCYKMVDTEDTEFTLQEAGLQNNLHLPAPFTQHCVIEVVSEDCKLPMVSIDARQPMIAMQDRIKYWFDRDALECSYFSIFYNVSGTKTRNVCWDMLSIKPMYWIFSKQRSFWMFARFRDNKIAIVAGGITIYFHSTGDYRCDLNGNSIFDAVNAGRARSVGGAAESAKAMAIILPTTAVCLLLVLGFIYWKYVREPLSLDEEQPPEEDGGGGEAGGEMGEPPEPTESAEPAQEGDEQPAEEAEEM